MNTLFSNTASFSSLKLQQAGSNGRSIPFHKGHNNIVPALKFLYSPYYLAWEKLKEISMFWDKMNLIFSEENFVYLLRTYNGQSVNGSITKAYAKKPIEWNNTSGTNINAIVLYTDSEIFVRYEDFYQEHMYSVLTDIMAVQTIVHEVTHSYIHGTQEVTSNGENHHNQMANDYRKQFFIPILKQFKSDNKMNDLDDTDLDIISWYGLGRTDKFVAEFGKTEGDALKFINDEAKLVMDEYDFNDSNLYKQYEALSETKKQSVKKYMDYFKLTQDLNWGNPQPYDGDKLPQKYDEFDYTQINKDLIHHRGNIKNSH